MLVWSCSCCPTCWLTECRWMCVCVGLLLGCFVGLAIFAFIVVVGVAVVCICLCAFVCVFMSWFMTGFSPAATLSRWHNFSFSIFSLHILLFSFLLLLLWLLLLFCHVESLFIFFIADVRFCLYCCCCCFCNAALRSFVAVSKKFAINVYCCCCCCLYWVVEKMQESVDLQRLFGVVEILFLFDRIYRFY